MYETAVVNYANISGVFIGIGGLVLLLVMAYFIYQLVRSLRSSQDYEDKYLGLKESLLDRVAANAGIDLEKEMQKKSLRPSKSFRKRLEEEMFDEMFEKKAKK